MRWPGSGVSDFDGYQVYYAGNNDAIHLNENAVIVAKTASSDEDDLEIFYKDLNDALDLV